MNHRWDTPGSLEGSTRHPRVLLLRSALTACATKDIEGNAAGECSDDADNDSDGLFDCADPDCAGSGACQPENDADTDSDSDTCTDSDTDTDAFIREQAHEVTFFFESGTELGGGIRLTREPAWPRWRVSTALRVYDVRIFWGTGCERSTSSA